MELKQLYTDDDAVSPVIGVILMVAITVILAAVIASFVLGLGDTTNTTPTASFDTSYDAANEEVTIVHQSGDTLNADRVSVKIDGTDIADGPYSYAGSGFSSEISSGSSATVSGLDGGQTVTVTWASSGGDSSATLTEFEVPLPSASFSFDYDDGDDKLVIAYQSGDAVTDSQVTVKSSSSSSSQWGSSGDSITAGDTVTVGDSSNSAVSSSPLIDEDPAGNTYTVVWESDSGDSSSTLGEFEAPS